MCKHFSARVFYKQIARLHNKILVMKTIFEFLRKKNLSIFKCRQVFYFYFFFYFPSNPTDHNCTINTKGRGENSTLPYRFFRLLFFFCFRFRLSCENKTLNTIKKTPFVATLRYVYSRETEPGGNLHFENDVLSYRRSPP